MSTTKYLYTTEEIAVTMKVSWWLLLLVLRDCVAWEATWESLDSRPLPPWYDEAKFGIFTVWGVYSVPSYITSWFQERWLRSKYHDFIEFVNKTEVASRFAYNDYAERFRAELYDPAAWADLFANSGAQYTVWVSKHHDGYCTWNSTRVAATRGWNSVDVGPRRDLLGDFANAIKQTVSPYTNQTIRFGAYHSMYEWFNPAYIQDRQDNYTKRRFPPFKTIPELYDLVEQYEPELIWSDGAFEAPSEYWQSTQFLAWYSTNSSVAKTAVWNDRFGRGCKCRNGGFFTCTDRYGPGRLVPHKWEDATSIDTNAWQFSRLNHYQHYIPTQTLIHQLIEAVAFNGNYLLAVGPEADGTIPPILVDRLVGIGAWMKVNGEAIYGTRPFAVAQNETDTYYTTKAGKLYAMVTNWPRGGQPLYLAAPDTSTSTSVTMLGVEEPLEWSPGVNSTTTTGLQIHMPKLTPNKVPCSHAWTIVLTNLRNYKQYVTPPARKSSSDSSS